MPMILSLLLKRALANITTNNCRSMVSGPCIVYVYVKNPFYQMYLGGLVSSSTVYRCEKTVSLDLVQQRLQGIQLPNASDTITEWRARCTQVQNCCGWSLNYVPQILWKVHKFCSTMIWLQCHHVHLIGCLTASLQHIPHTPQVLLTSVSADNISSKRTAKS